MLRRGVAFFAVLVLALGFMPAGVFAQEAPGDVIQADVATLAGEIVPLAGEIAPLAVEYVFSVDKTAIDFVPGYVTDTISVVSTGDGSFVEYVFSGRPAWLLLGGFDGTVTLAFNGDVNTDYSGSFRIVQSEGSGNSVTVPVTYTAPRYNLAVAGGGGSGAYRCTEAATITANAPPPVTCLTVGR